MRNDTECAISVKERFPNATGAVWYRNDKSDTIGCYAYLGNTPRIGNYENTGQARYCLFVPQDTLNQNATAGEAY